MYPKELRERATRMAVDTRWDTATKSGTLALIGQQLRINPETLRNWARQAKVQEGCRPGISADDTSRMAVPEKVVQELRGANAILRSASAFFAG